MNLKSDTDPELMRKLSLLQATSPRDPEKEKIGRAAFLAGAQEFAGAVTQPEKRRHNGWMHALQSIFSIRRKEHSPMFSAFATALLIVSLILGGGGITVAAAQNSQPDQALYSLKVWSEEARLDLSAGSQAEYQLALQFANRRADEIQALVQAGGIPPQTVQTRYQAQVEQAIQFAMNLPDEQAAKALQQIRSNLQVQQQAFLELQVNGSPMAEAAMLQTRQMLQERLQWVEVGLTDPAQLRDQLRKQDRLNSPTPVNQSTQLAPGTGSGNPWTTGTPTPGSEYGPGQGTGDCETCTPSGSGQGSNPWTTGTPTPGSGYGPGQGTGDCETCTPGSSNHTGPQPTQMQGGQPTQAGPQPTQQQNGQPTQSGSQPTQESSGPGPQSTPAPGGQGGKP
jgi:hypothetical protein